jgi:hypothetical protein
MRSGSLGKANCSKAAKLRIAWRSKFLNEAAEQLGKLKKEVREISSPQDGQCVSKQAHFPSQNAAGEY